MERARQTGKLVLWLDKPNHPFNKMSGLLIGLAMGVLLLGGCQKTEPLPGHTYNNDLMQSSSGAQYLAHEVIVKKVPEVSLASFKGEITKLNGRIVSQQSDLTDKLGFFRIQLPKEITADQAISTLRVSGVAQSAERNYVVNLVATPNDPRFSELWGMKKIEAQKTWDLEKGSKSVVVAVSDTGVDRNHSDLAANMWRNPNEIAGNGIDDDGNGYVDDVHGWDLHNNDANPHDDHGHGTHVSGTIGGVGNNGVGVVGVNWDVEIMAIKFLSASGSGYLTDGAESILYAAENGAKVLNASWGCNGCFTQYMEDAIQELADSGGLFAVAAGNSSADNGVTPHYPAAHNVSNVVAVAATDSNDNLAGFSNYGGSTVHIAAPGVSILSTFPGNSYKSWQGTSMASPHVAGAAALLMAYNPNATVDEVKQRLMSTSDQVASLNGKTISGGRLNLYKLITTDSSAPEPPAGFSATPGVRSDVNLSWSTGEEEDLAWYRIAWSTTSGAYAESLDVPAGQTAARILELENDVPHYFVLYAIDSFGNMSAPCEEVAATPTDSMAPAQVLDLTANPAPGQVASGEVIAASSESSEYYQAQNAYDGSPLHGWVSMPSEEMREEYVVVEFGKSMIVDRVVLSAVQGYEKFFPIDFDIEVSLNGTDWQVVGGLRNAAALNDETVEIRFPAVQVQAMRLTVLKTTQHSSGLYYTGIGEMTAYQISNNPDLLELRFTAPGDDPGEGRAETYDIRYDTFPVDDNSFDSATPIDSYILPTLAGVQERVNVDGLVPESTYYFAMKAMDEAGNVSPLSNLATSATLVVPPSAITDLAVTHAASGQVTLAWTATGEDGLVGQASAYDLRYSTNPIDPGNFESAVIVPDVSAPSPSGTLDGATVTGLVTGQLYYFAIRAVDDNNAKGGLSNVVSAVADGGEDLTPPATVNDLDVYASNADEKLNLEVLEWSSELASYYDGTKLADGSINTYWFSGYGKATDPEWAVVDFGKVEPVTRFRMHASYYGGYLDYYPQDFDIEVSSDAVNWSPIVHAEGIIGELNTWNEWSTPVTYARYARIYTRLRGPAACMEPYGCVNSAYVIISELEAYGSTPEFEAQLLWVAPGDDDWLGMAMAYDLRRSKEPITPLNFSSAQEIPIPVPQPAGMLEVAEVTNLDWESNYYFALKTGDDSNNWSDISNIGEIATPAVPPAPVGDLLVADATMNEITLSWTATGDDGYDGTATGYDLRYLNEPITIGNWGFAIPVDDAPLPSSPGTAESVTVYGLDHTSLYYFAIKVIDDWGWESPLSNIAFGETIDATPPNAITDLSVATNESTFGSLNVTWTAPGDDGVSGKAKQYDLRVSTGPIVESNFSSAMQVMISPPKASGEAETAVLTGLNPETLYYVAIKTKDENENNSALSNVAQNQTRNEHPDPVADLTVTSATKNSLNLGWTATGDDADMGTATGYDLRYLDVPITSGNWDGAVPVIDLPDPSPSGTSEALTVFDLSPTSQYFFALKVTDDLGNESGMSNIAQGETLDGTAPVDVTDLVAETNHTTRGSLILSWTAPGDDGTEGNATQYVLRVSTSPIDDTNFDEATRISTPIPKVAGQPEAVIAEGLEPELLYYAALRTNDESGNVSGISNIASSSTRNEAPFAVNDLKVVSTTSTQATVEWTAPGDDGADGTATTYTLKYLQEPLNIANWAQGTVVQNTPDPSPSGTVEAVVVSGLNPDTGYYFAVIATDDLGNQSGLSNNAQGSTLDEIAPSAVADLQAGPVDPGNAPPLSVTVSDSSGAYSSENGTEKLIDGIEETNWLSPARDTVEEEFIQFDLEKPTRLGRLRMLAASGYGDLFPIEFHVEVKTDAGGSWIPVINETEFDTEGEWEEWALGSIQAVQVRLVMTQTALWTGKHYASISEIEFYEDPTDFTTINLSWTAPGDDGDSGSCSTYDIRSAALPIDTDSAFQSADPIANQPTPGPAGSLERTQVEGLEPEEETCFALKARDDSNNLSTLSNTVCASTPGLPPSTITDLRMTNVTSSSVNLAWTAPGGQGQDGQSDSYQLTLSKERINLDNWDSLEHIYGLPIPGPFGTDETFTVEGLEGATEYYFAIRAVDGSQNVGSISNNAIATTRDDVPPSGVTDLAAETDDTTWGGIIVTWTAPGDNGVFGQATEYDLRVSLSPIHQGNFNMATRVDAPLPSPALDQEMQIVDGLDPETLYYVAVKAIDGDGNVSDISNIASGRTRDESPSRVTDLAITQSSGSAVGEATLTMEWTSPGDNGDLGTASEYDIRFSTSPISTSNFEQATPIAETPAPLVSGTVQQVILSGLNLDTRYYVALKSIDDMGNISELSNVPFGTTADEVPPAGVDDLSAETGASKGVVVLSWTSTGDDGVDGRTSGYDLRYSSTPINESNFQAATPGQTQPPGSLADDTVTFTLRGLPDETQLHFALKAKDNAGNSSILSNDTTAWTPDVAPAKVTSLAQTARTLNTISLSWTAPGDDDNTGTAAAYDVRYSVSPITALNFEDATQAASSAPQPAGDLESMVIAGLLGTTTYYIALKTVDERNNWSQISNVLTAQTADDEAPGQVVDLAAQTGPANGTIKLTWTAPGDDGNQGRAALYELRHSSNPINETNWDEALSLTGIPSPGEAGAIQQFTANGLAGETQFYFAILAVDEEGNEGSLSNSPSAWTPAIPPSAVTDLEGQGGSQSVVLGWTAPGDDGMSGTATAYDIRYSIQAITGINFEGATQVTGEPDPETAGNSLSMTVNGLQESTTYWFAMKSIDDYGAISNISNVIQVTTADETAPSQPGSLSAIIPDSGGTAIVIESVEATSSLSTSFGPENTIDSDEQTSWVSSGTETALTEKLTFDFGTIQTIDRLELLPDETYLNLFPHGFSVHSSEDGNTWQVVMSESEFEAVDAEWITWGFEPSDARYVQLWSYDQAGSFFGLSYSVISEVEVLAAASTEGEVKLTWVAPGDDGYQGQADHYQVFRHTAPFDESTLDTATLLADPPAPESAGTLQTMTQSGLLGESTYYFAVRALDDAGNLGQLSDVISATTCNIPPAPVSDLQDTDIGLEQVTLSWTATGDDGKLGTADNYEMRYAAWSLTTQNFPLAEEVLDMPLPLPSGETQSVTVKGLAPGTTYRFGVVTRDETGASSYLSNIAIVTTEPTPDDTPPLEVVDLVAEVPSNGGQPIPGEAVAWSSEQPPDFRAGALSDGDMETMWSSAAASQNGEEWVRIDLGNPLPSDKVRIWPSSNYLDLFPLGFEVRVSPDGLEWISVYNESDCIPLEDTPFEGSFPAMPVRYVEFVATDLAVFDNGYYYAVVAEVEVLSVDADPGTIMVNWTASGDDGAEGTAATYDLRIGSCPYNHAGATHVNTETPQQAGNTENLRVSGLEDGTYCLGLIVADEAGNESLLSNIADVDLGM